MAAASPSDSAAPPAKSGPSEAAAATPRRQPPPPPKAPPRDHQGRRTAEQARGGEAEEEPEAGQATPTEDSYESATEEADDDQAAPSTATPWARRIVRKTTSAKSAALPPQQHVSLAPVTPGSWEPAAMEAGSVSPPVSEWEWPPTPRDPDPADFASLSEVAAALPSTTPSGLEAVVMDVDDGSPSPKAAAKSPPANPSSPGHSEGTSDTLPSGTSKVVDSTPLTSQPTGPVAANSSPEGSSAADHNTADANQAAGVDSPTSPAETTLANEGGVPSKVTTATVDGIAPPRARAGDSGEPAVVPSHSVAPAEPAGAPQLLRLDVSCQVGTHLVVLRMAMTANSTVGAVLARARERASAPGLEVASLHTAPDVALSHVATLGSVLPPGELRLLLREGTSPVALASTTREAEAVPCLFSPDRCWCYCCGIGTACPLLMQAHAMTDRHVWNARVFVRRHRQGHPDA
ncbi:unnamed protein product [Symbiodinium necroappetens]|uniref:Uncharacterized protein n=1 Tax=Symbiodinium necroappetens TaxID=1628268 RepID=A0A813BS04_9DINO|nr:unnamed protein product [Symbiodinium necroappetens]